MTGVAIRPCTRKAARAFVRAHHSHHKGRTQAADIFRLSAWVADACVAVAIANSATAPGLQSDSVWEIGRLCCGSSAPKYTASRLLGALGRIMDAAGVELAISYCRIDERGSCYLAAGWRPVAICKGRQHNTGNRAARWLPGLGEDRPSTEIVDRVRWERGPKAAAASLAWDGARWAERTTA